MAFNNSHNKIDTKKKALKLIYDQACLLSLLYSKYGEIEEDYNILIINQLVYDCSSHLNIIFKEYQFSENYDEYLKRWYKIQESSNRIPKLSDYYKNYHKFFCRPNFNDFIISNLMHNYGDDKAELFYKKNFEFSNSEMDENTEKNNTSALSSIDNITNNKTIFTNKNKFIIEGNEQSINYSMTLTLNNTTINSIQNNKKNLKSSRSIKDSFEEIVHNLVYYQKKINNKKNKKKKKYINNINEKNNNNNKKEIAIKKNNEKYQPQKKLIYTINYLDKNKSNNKKNNKDKKSPKQLTILSKPNIIINHNNNNNHNKINGIINNQNILNSIFKAFNSPKNVIKGRHSHKTKLEEYNNNYIQRNNNNYHHRNKTYNFTQNYSLSNQSGDILNHNIINLINLKSLLKNTSQNRVKSNYILNFKGLTNKQILKKKKKNITFDNNIYTQINQISSMPFLKYKKASSSNQKLNSQYKSNKNIIKNNGFIGSKFNLVKNLKTTNNPDRNKGKKHSSYNFYQNILTQIVPGNDNRKNKKKNITSFGINNNTSNSSKKNKSISPINGNKNDIVSNNNNEIRNRNKIGKNQINNFNINFNNVFFTSSKPSSYILDNNKNINNSNAYNSISINRNINNNSLYNNYNNFVNSNILEQENKPNKNLYVMNLKNIYNFSRNKNNILINNNPLTQIESNHPKIQNNYNIIHIKKNNTNNNAKTIFEKNITHENFNYQHGAEDTNINNKNHNNKNVNLNENQKIQINSNIINYIRKAQSNFIMRNQNRNNLELPKNNNVINTGDDSTKNNFKNNKSFNCSKNIYSSSSVSRRKNKNKINTNTNNYNKIQKTNGKKVSSLTSQKNIKSKYKRKIK